MKISLAIHNFNYHVLKNNGYRKSMYYLITKYRLQLILLLLTWYRKGRHNPAIGVHNISWNSIAHTVDGFSDQTIGSDQN